MSKGFEFVVIENPVVKRSVDIALGGRQAKKLEMVWNRLSMEDAADVLEDYSQRTAFYVDVETGEPLSLTEAAKEFLKLGDTDGQSMPVPILHDYVESRSTKDRLIAQREFLREMVSGVMGDGSDDVPSLLEEWNLTQGSEVMDFRDPEVFDAVFKTNEFFFPVLTDMLQMFNELVSGQDKIKNSKTSGGSSRAGRRGSLKA